jgi:hypothetical protein
MKKLVIICLFFACNNMMNALESASTKSRFAFGQMCGDDNCQCPEHKRPEQIV